MSDLIHVRPTREQRRAFAVWATEQRPKVRTVSPTTFAVPACLFTDVPEAVLIGALVDGHRYVSPDEEAPANTPMREAVPGQPLPEVPDEAYPPGAVALDPPVFAPLEDAPVENEDQEPDELTRLPSYLCQSCGRTYATERGLSRHRRQKHPEGA